MWVEELAQHINIEGSTRIRFHEVQTAQLHDQLCYAEHEVAKTKSVIVPREKLAENLADRLSSANLEEQNIFQKANDYIDNLYSEFRSWEASTAEAYAKLQELHAQASSAGYWATQELDVERKESSKNAAKLEMQLNFYQSAEMAERARVKELNLKCDQVSSLLENDRRRAAERLAVTYREIEKLRTSEDRAAVLEDRLRADIKQMRDDAERMKDEHESMIHARDIDFVRVGLELKEAQSKPTVSPMLANLRAELREMKEEHGQGKCVSKPEAESLMKGYRAQVEASYSDQKQKWDLAMDRLRRQLTRTTESWEQEADHSQSLAAENARLRKRLERYKANTNVRFDGIERNGQEQEADKVGSPQESAIPQICELCGEYARVPYPRCSICGGSPCFHHNRCCEKRSRGIKIGVGRAKAGETLTGVRESATSTGTESGSAAAAAGLKPDSTHATPTRWACSGCKIVQNSKDKFCSNCGTSQSALPIVLLGPDVNPPPAGVAQVTKNNETKDSKEQTMLQRCEQVNNALQLDQQRTRLVYQKDTIFAPVTCGNQARYAPAATTVHPNGAPVLPSMFLTGGNLPYAIENPPVAMGRPTPFTGSIPVEQKEGPYCKPYVPPPGSVPISLDPSRQGVPRVPFAPQAPGSATVPSFVHPVTPDWHYQGEADPSVTAMAQGIIQSGQPEQLPSSTYVRPETYIENSVITRRPRQYANEDESPGGDAAGYSATGKSGSGGGRRWG